MPSLLPPDFRFGVATAGFQCEGGFNGPGEPSNNWAEWEREGRVEPSGVALDFWNLYAEHFDRAASLGCDTFRLSVEWARVEPAPGEIDTGALDRYAAILDACRARGMEPVVTLHHFTHPAWLGRDFWLRGDSPERFAEWVGTAVGHLADRCTHWVTVNEANIYSLMSYVSGQFPPGRRLDARAMVRSLDHQMAGHVLAYAEIHRRQPAAVAAVNNFTFDVYEFDRMLTDVLLAREAEVGEGDVGRWLVERRRRFYAEWGTRTRRDALIHRAASVRVPLARALPRTIGAVYASEHERCLDVSQLDYYDPVVGHQVRIPGHRTAGGRDWSPGTALWDTPPDPAGLARACRGAVVPGLDVWVVENGVCNRVRRGRSYPRSDGWDRPRYLRENLAAVVRAADEGIPVTAYLHWTLADNYEWGSYEPRFGLFGVDRERGVRWMSTDAMGQDSPGAYRRLIEGLRSGDRSVLSA